MHNGAANKALVNVSNIGCGTSAKTQTCSWESFMFCRVYISLHMQRNGVGQVERTHTRTLLRNSHLNTITVTKTCSKKRHKPYRAMNVNGQIVLLYSRFNQGKSWCQENLWKNLSSTFLMDCVFRGFEERESAISQN